MKQEDENNLHSTPYGICGIPNKTMDPEPPLKKTSRVKRKAEEDPQKPRKKARKKRPRSRKEVDCAAIRKQGRCAKYADVCKWVPETAFDWRKEDKAGCQPLMKPPSNPMYAIQARDDEKYRRIAVQRATQGHRDALLKAATHKGPRVDPSLSYLVNRKCPPVKASTCTIGQRKRGINGKMWVVSQRSDGVLTWKPVVRL